MRLFIDTANMNEIKETYELGIISGVTTNPTIVAREGNKDFFGVIKEIADMVDGEIFAEVTALDAPGMIEEGRKLAKLHKNLIVKIPMCAEGLKAVKVLSSEGIKINVTLVFSACQALLAANAGASYVSIFAGRVDDTGIDGINTIADVAEIFALHGIETEVLVASIRNPIHVLQSAKAGADICTVPYKVLMQMINHPQSKSGLEGFMKDWAKLNA